MSRIERRKYIKDKYFEVVGFDPHYYRFKDKYNAFVLSKLSLEVVIDIIIDILEQECGGGIIWAKTT